MAQHAAGTRPAPAPRFPAMLYRALRHWYHAFTQNCTALSQKCCTAPSDIGTTLSSKTVPRFPANLYHGFWTHGTLNHIVNCNSPCIMHHFIWPNCTTVSNKRVPPNHAHLYHGFCEKTRVHEMTKPSHIDAPTQLKLLAMHGPRPGQMLGQSLSK